MARRNKLNIDIGAEADQALQRVTALAHRLAAGLAGEKLPESGRLETSEASAVAAAMFLFLLSIDPDDLHALFFGKGSMKQFAFTPRTAENAIPALFADHRSNRHAPVG